jgi:hypothetical protein
VSRVSFIGGLLGLLVAAVASLSCACGAFALSQRGHVFAFSYGSKGKGEGQFSAPEGVAVDEATGDLYVADRKNKRVVQLEPVLGGSGQSVGEKFVRSFKVPGVSSVAVDNSPGGSGDVYVVGASAVHRFTSSGVPVGEPIKKFVLSGSGIKEKLKGVVGIAVDESGSLFVYQEDGQIYEFGAGEASDASLLLETGLPGAPGFALDSRDDLFVGVREASLSVVAKLEGLTGQVLIPRLDGESSSAVAVNTHDAPANEVDERDDVYVDNGTSVAQFAPEAEGKSGALIERFPAVGEVQAHGGPIMQSSSGVAVDGRTGTVYVTDAAVDDVSAFVLEPAGAPRIEGLSAHTALSSDGGAELLSAQVDPTGGETHAYLEYGTAVCASEPSGCVRGESVDLGAGFATREVSVEPRDLAPGVYHYRLVLEGPLGTVQSAEQSFTVLAQLSGLPDGRAWELVSPANKHGASVEALPREGGLILASGDGNALAYVVNGALGEVPANRSPEMEQVLATRESDGWGSQVIVTPQVAAQGLNASFAPEYQFFSSDLSLALVAPFGRGHALAEPPLSPPLSQAEVEHQENTIYLRDDQPIAPDDAEQQLYSEAQTNSGFLAPGYLPLVTAANVWPGTAFGGREGGEEKINFAGATPGLDRVVLKSSLSLTGPGSGAGLYEWSPDGVLRFVSHLPGEEGGGPAAEATLGAVHVAAHALSSDGSRVIWTNHIAKPGHLYITDIVTGKTVRLDKAVENVAEPPNALAQFQSASSDGSRVLFTDPEKLTAQSSVEPVERLADLYSYECASGEEPGGPDCKLKDLTADVANPGEHAAVQELILGASEDCSHVYLVAQGVLASNRNGGGETAQSGKDNLYELRYQAGKWSSTFIATLSEADAPDWDANGQHKTVVSATDTAFQTARVSPNGEYLAFMSQQSLTGYDNEDVSSVQPGERMDEEVYLYGAQTEGLTCVSCDPSGAQPRGVYDQELAGEGFSLLVDRRQVWSESWLAGSIPGWSAQSEISAIFQSRYLNDEGRLFFDSTAPLVPVPDGGSPPTRGEEINGHTQQVGVEKVYEYEPAGVGGCQQSAAGAGGCVALISSGASPDEAAFQEATPSGNDVFFLTAAQLSPQDTDVAFDMYDARVCTSESPCLSSPPPLSAGCGEVAGCRTASFSPPGSVGASGSASASGPGNPASTPRREVEGVVTKKQTSKPLTLAQKLIRALRACRERNPHTLRKRQVCEAHARGQYGPEPKPKTANEKKQGGRR